MGFLGGQGVEYWYNGLTRFPSWKGLRGGNGEGGMMGYVEVEGGSEVNGEKVEGEMTRERRVQGLRSLVAGLGFVMGVIGIWGDGA